MAFRKFTEFGSVRQVTLWLIDESVKMPVTVYGAQGRVVEWRAPRYNTIHRLLTNPIYAGAYAFGRTGSQTSVEAGRKAIKRGIRRAPDAWEVLLRDHHEGYISWEEYERNQQTIGGNANMKGEMVKGSVRNGGGLLVGLLRCGRCGRKLKSSTTDDAAWPAICAMTATSITGGVASVLRSGTCGSTRRYRRRFCG